MGQVRHRAGRLGEAAAEFQKAITIMEHLSDLQPSSYDLYNLACFQSLLSGIAALPGSGLTNADVHIPRQKAVATLQAVARRRGLARLLRPSEKGRRPLVPLRSRPDFRLLLSRTWHFPSQPFAR